MCTKHKVWQNCNSKSLLISLDLVFWVMSKLVLVFIKQCVYVFFDSRSHSVINAPWTGNSSWKKCFRIHNSYCMLFCFIMHKFYSMFILHGILWNTLKTFSKWFLIFFNRLIVLWINTHASNFFWCAKPMSWITSKHKILWVDLKRCEST